MSLTENLAQARILVTNDDGINAPGLKILEDIARELSSDVWVVAPESEQSGASHSLTLSNPLRFRDHGGNRFSVGGTPTDCVVMAASVIVPAPVALVVSGVNRGGNTAEDIGHSGTVAAAMEGASLGIPAIAFSQGLDFEALEPDVHWPTAAAYGARITRLLIEKGDWLPGTLYNVNFPNCPPGKVMGIKVVAQGKRGLPKKLTRAVDPKGREYYWLNWADEKIDPGHLDSDIRWVHENYITITPLTVQLTDKAMLTRLKSSFEALPFSPTGA